MVQFSFDATQVKPNSGSADIVPAGMYIVAVTRSEFVPTKAGDGHMLVLTLTIQNGDYAGSVLVDRLNLRNNNSKAVEIAYGQLSAICHVTGVMRMQQTEELHGRPFQVKVTQSPRNDDPSKMGNEIKGYYDVNGNEPGAQPAQGQAAPQQPAQPAQPSAPQWQQPPAQPAQAAPAPATGGMDNPTPPPFANGQPSASTAAPSPQWQQPAAAAPAQQAAPAPSSPPGGVPAWAQG